MTEQASILIRLWKDHMRTPACFECLNDYAWALMLFIANGPWTTYPTLEGF